MSERQKKTPRTRAEEALGVAGRKVKRLNDERAKHHAHVARLNDEIEAACQRLEYAQANPDLGTEPAQPDNTEGTPA